MSRNKFPLVKILILVTILAVPGFLYYLLQAKGKNRYKPLPVYGPKVIADTFKEKRGVKIPDTIFHHVKGFTATNQEGSPFYIDSIESQLLVVNFFYTRNKNIVPEMYEHLDELYTKYKDNKRLRFLSVTVDPEYDTREELAAFASTHQAESGKWDFVRADTTSVFSLANKELFVNAFKSEDILVHSEKLVLLDAEHRIRGYYNATSLQEVKKLSEEIKVLIAEELRKIK